MSAESESAGKPARMGPADLVATALATWFGCGLIPRAPGTWGTIGAVPLYLVLAPHGPLAVLLAAAAATLIGIWAAERVARRLHTHDPQIVCLDEVAGVLITLAPAPRTWLALVVGVVLFRLLDVVKPWPARLAERKLPGGLGVMLDDVFAGAWGAGLMLLARQLGWL
jgi:phosphatidylglycerophosphatase A